MSPRRRLLVAVLVLVVVAVGVVVGVRVFGGPGQPIPGTRPADDRPGPVVLVPGYGGSRTSLQALARRIEATGRQATVLTLVGDGTGDLSAQVTVLDRAVDEALAAGAPSVDVVGYSAGGVVTALWLAREDGASKTRRVVTLGAPLHGTTLATAGASLAPDACPVACRQLVPGSPELAEIEKADVGSELPWLSLWTTDDDTVTPPESARLAGALDTSVQAVCAGARVTHSGLPTDPLVTGAVLRALGTTPLTLPGPADCAGLRRAG
ncbi:lipase [Pseudonocardia sulfidoxydans NBRC 16205]|uniref:Lipase n=1 Tax=Pseudonocardia sulfidoxydans NBRC 16205 TaxID=1223511 RepID=A0A511DIM0_9PSEU|nr:lipase [Pseudonocardia sulfidoxydans]GEL24662.1 lipase [Pseudonocardia sulfidoxydans NBRC 16205]